VTDITILDKAAQPRLYDRQTFTFTRTGISKGVSNRMQLYLRSVKEQIKNIKGKLHGVYKAITTLLERTTRIYSIFILIVRLTLLRGTYRNH